MDTVYIRPDQNTNFKRAIAVGLFILYYFIGPYDYTRIIYTKSPEWTIVLGIVFFGLFFFYLKNLILNHPEITLTVEGIELKQQGWTHWEFVDSYQRLVEKDIENNRETESLVLHLKTGSSITCIISDLDKDSLEILDLIKQFKANSIGHD